LREELEIELLIIKQSQMGSSSQEDVQALLEVKEGNVFEAFMLLKMKRKLLCPRPHKRA